MVNGGTDVDVVNALGVLLVYFDSQFFQMCKMYILIAVLDGHWCDYLDRDELRLNLQSYLRRRVMGFCRV